MATIVKVDWQKTDKKKLSYADFYNSDDSVRYLEVRLPFEDDKHVTIIHDELKGEVTVGLIIETEEGSFLELYTYDSKGALISHETEPMDINDEE